MASDEINRSIEFILQNQANHANRIEETERQFRNLAASTSSFHEDMKEFIKVLVPLLEHQSKRLDRLEGQA